MCQCQFSTVTDLQRDMGCCPKSLTTRMVADYSPTSCPTAGCVLIPSDWTSRICLYKQTIVDSCKWMFLICCTQP